MKKLFIAAMALATIVSCSKDDAEGPALDSNNKSVSITIVNSSNGTRANASIQDETKSNVVAETDAKKLDILFAAGDVIVCRKSLVGDSETHGSGDAEFTYGQTTTNGNKVTYEFHNIPAAVTAIAVVRTDDVKDTDYSVAAANTKNMTLTAYKTLAESETANVNRTLDQIVLYGEDKQLKDLNTTHEVNGIAYHMWQAEVTVEPLVARLEITKIGCTDLGNLNTNDNLKDYGYDELDINTLKWGSHQIEPTVGDTEKIIGTVYSQGEYISDATGADTNRQPVAGSRSNTLTAGSDKVWAWNIAPTNNITSDNKMVIDITPYAYGYSIAETIKSKKDELKIDKIVDNSGNTVTFEKGKIYKLPIEFTEADITNTDAALCVEVVVEIASWTIVDNIKPNFAN